MTRTVEDLGSEIDSRWSRLGPPSPDGELKVLDLPQALDAGPLLLGVASDGSRLLVPLEPDAHRGFRPDRKSRGVQLLLRQIEQAEGNRWYLDVVCLQGELRWLFSSFLADVLLRFERHPGVQPTAIVRTCFTAWRALFAGAGHRMTMKQLAGLYGELNILGRLLERSRTATEVWRGPDASPHDFVAPGLDLEVKTTLSSEDDVVHIHGLGQLAEPDGGELRLVHLRVETPGADGESLDEIIERLLRLDSTGRLPALLAAAGYTEAERRIYGEVTFQTVAEGWYRVNQSFPRLTAASFPHGHVPDALAEFRYTLDLGQISAVPLGETDIEDTLDELSR